MTFDLRPLVTDIFMLDVMSDMICALNQVPEVGSNLYGIESLCINL